MLSSLLLCFVPENKLKKIENPLGDGKLFPVLAKLNPIVCQIEFGTY